MMQGVFLLDVEPIELSDSVSMETHQNVNDACGLIGIRFCVLIVHRPSRATSDVF